MLLVDESPSKCRVGRRPRGNFTTPACCRKLRRLCYIRLTPPWRPTGHIRLVYPSRRKQARARSDSQGASEPRLDVSPARDRSFWDFVLVGNCPVAPSPLD
jgi:hypothetical protein